MNILKTLLTRYNQTNFLTLLKMLDHKLCGWYLDVFYGYDVCLAWLWIQLRLIPLKLGLFMIWIMLGFVSFLMWVHHLIDDILDDQDWIVHLVNINLCYLGCWTLDQPPQMTYGLQNFGLWIQPKSPSLLNLFANKCDPSIRTILEYFLESWPYNVFLHHAPSPKLKFSWAFGNILNLLVIFWMRF